MEMYCRWGLSPGRVDFKRVRMVSLEERSSRKLGLEGDMIVRALKGRSGNETTRVVSVETKAGL